MVLKLKLPNKLMRFVYKFVDIESGGNMSMPDDRMIEYSFALSRAIDEISPPAKILDIGCVARINPIPQTLCELGYDVTGIDIRDFYYKHGNFTFIKDDVISCKFAGKYDVVTAVSTIEHIGINGRYGVAKYEDEADYKTVEKVGQILEYNGLFIFTVPYNKVEKRTGIQRYYNTSRIKYLLGDKFTDIRMKYYVRRNGELSVVEEGTDDIHLVCVTARRKT